MLEQELQLLKNEIQATLLDIREHLLTHAYPSLRAEDAAESPVQPERPAAHPHVTVSARTQARNDASPETPVPAVKKVTLQPSQEDDEQDTAEKDVTSAPLVRKVSLNPPDRPEKPAKPARVNVVGKAKLPEPDLNPEFEPDGATMPPRDDRRRLAKQRVPEPKPEPEPKQPPRASAVRSMHLDDYDLDDEEEEAPPPFAVTGQQEYPMTDAEESLAELAELEQWAGQKVEQVGVERTRALIRMHAEHGRFDEDVMAALLRYVASLEALNDVPPAPVKLGAPARLRRPEPPLPVRPEPATPPVPVSAQVEAEVGPEPEEPPAAPNEPTQNVVLRLIAGVQNIGVGSLRKKNNG
jgi:hypothetical protein